MLPSHAPALRSSVAVESLASSDHAARQRDRAVHDGHAQTVWGDCAPIDSAAGVLTAADVAHIYAGVVDGELLFSLRDDTASAERAPIKRS